MAEAEAVTGRRRILGEWTAVDLITVALLGVVYRIFWYIYRLFSWAWPWNTFLNLFFQCVPLAMAVTIVGKPGTSTLYYISWMLFNLFFQGEDLIVIPVLLPMALISDAYWILVGKYGASKKSVVIGTAISGLLFLLLVWPLLLYFFVIPVDTPIWLLEIGISMVGVVVAGFLGYNLGKRIEPLLG